MKLTEIKLSQDACILLSIFCLYLGLGTFFLKDYVLWDSQWLLALVLVPLVAQVQPGKTLPRGLVLAVAGTAILAATLQNTTLFFFAFVMALWCAAQLLFGRVTLYPVMLLFVASPIFKYIANILSFPLRLQLTSWSVAILSAVDKSAEAAGNIILLNGEEFSVDPACAGLSMLSLSLLLGVFVLAHLQKANKRRWRLWLLGGMLAVMLLLNIFSNLLRILLLVWFSILPENPMHDVVGILCLVVYALLPFYFLASRLHKRFGKPFNNSTNANLISLRGSLLLNYLLLLILTGSGFLMQLRKHHVLTKSTPHFAGFTIDKLKNGVTRYSNREALIYLKPIQAFYSTEHHPLVCWEGSGYKFRYVQQRMAGHNKVFVGELQKGGDILYTAWWMDNGNHQTIDQWDWRWRMLRGEAKFRLINVTAASQKELSEAIEEVMEQVMDNNASVASAL